MNEWMHDEYQVLWWIWIVQIMVEIPQAHEDLSRLYDTVQRLNHSFELYHTTNPLPPSHALRFIDVNLSMLFDIWKIDILRPAQMLPSILLGIPIFKLLYVTCSITGWMIDPMSE